LKGRLKANSLLHSFRKERLNYLFYFSILLAGPTTIQFIDCCGAACCARIVSLLFGFVSLLWVMGWLASQCSATKEASQTKQTANETITGAEE